MYFPQLQDLLAMFISILKLPPFLLLSWKLHTQPNGVIIGYNYSCTQTESPMKFFSGSVTTTSALIEGLLPGCYYYCSVSASTLSGVGASSATLNATTYEDG